MTPDPIEILAALSVWERTALLALCVGVWISGGMIRRWAWRATR